LLEWEIMPAVDILSLLDKKQKKKMKPKEVYEEYIESNPSEYIDTIMEGFQSDISSVQSGCGNLATYVVRDNPDLLYPHVEFFLSGLDSKKSAMKWCAYEVVGHLSAVDERKLILPYAEKIRQDIGDKSAVLQWCVVDALTRIAVSYPEIADDTIQLFIDSAHLFPKNRVGFVISAMEFFLDKKENVLTIKDFVSKYIDHEINVVSKRAKKVLKKIEKLEG
jgi:hypothetical protein